MLEKLVIQGLILFFMAVAVYIPVMNGGIIYDDDQLLTQNMNIQRGNGFLDKESWRGLASIWFPEDKAVSADYFPVTGTSLWFEWRLWGNNDPKTPPQFKGIGAAGVPHHEYPAARDMRNSVVDVILAAWGAGGMGGGYHLGGASRMCGIGGVDIGAKEHALHAVFFMGHAGLA